MKRIKFLQRDVNKKSSLGRGRKKKQKWRKPKGRDNKMREKRKGKPRTVSIGYKKNKLNNKEKIIVIKNLKDLEKIGKEDIGLIGNIGKKKKIEIIEKAKEKGIKLKNTKIKEKNKK
ncbi:MAG: eL32 family ribosomal protein [Nanoarchaeota archaeon]